MAINTAQGSGQLYDWGDGHGRSHSRPKKTKPSNIAGQPIWGGAGQIGAGHPAPSYGAVPIQPPDPAQQAWQAQQNLNLGISNADATYQRGNLGYETGYNADGTRNYADPYNAAALLEDQYKRSLSGTTNSYASRGQLHTGAYGRMQGENARNLSIGSNSLQHQAANAYHGLDVGQATNAVQYGAGSQDQSLTALLKALGVGG